MVPKYLQNAQYSSSADSEYIAIIVCVMCVCGVNVPRFKERARFGGGGVFSV